MSLVKQTLTGIAWASVSRAIAQVASFLVTLLLARMLVPADFGLSAAVVLSGFRLACELGRVRRGAARNMDERHVERILAECGVASSPLALRYSRPPLPHSIASRAVMLVVS